MGELKKATLQAVEVAEDGVHDLDAAFEVQFNPTSLRLQRSNNTSSQPSERPTQSTGSDTTLSVELVFDSADEGATDAPVDVRARTARVAAFVVPRDPGQSEKSAPPSVRFSWGSVIVEGVMTGFSEDIDLFTSDGVPLRSRVIITIKEQDPKQMALRRGPGSNTGQGATKPGATTAGPGTLGIPFPNRTTFALGGETLAGLAARVGVDPAAWRGLSVLASLQAAGSLGLPAGVAVDFRAGLTAGGGLTTGAGAPPAQAAPAAALGGGGTTRGAVPPAPQAAGFALAAAGGVTAAAGRAVEAETAAETAAARAAFAAPAPPARAQTASTALTPRPLPPEVDQRAATFGRGVPLRRTVRIDGGAASGPPAGGPGDPPWAGLPPAAPDRQQADREQARRRPCTCSCRAARRRGRVTCSCGCGCGGH